MASWVRPADGPRTKVQPSGGATSRISAWSRVTLTTWIRQDVPGQPGPRVITQSSAMPSSGPDRPERLDLRLQTGPHQPGRPGQRQGREALARGLGHDQRPGPGGGQQPLAASRRRRRSRGRARRRSHHRSRSRPPPAPRRAGPGPGRRWRRRHHGVGRPERPPARSARVHPHQLAVRDAEQRAGTGQGLGCRAGPQPHRDERRVGGQVGGQPGTGSPAPRRRPAAAGRRAGPPAAEAGSPGSAVAVSVGSGSDDRSSAVSRPARDRPNTARPAATTTASRRTHSREAAGAFRLLALLHHIGHGRSIAGRGD